MTKKYYVSGETKFIDIAVRVEAVNEAMAVARYFSEVANLINRPIEIFIKDLLDISVEEEND